MPEPLEEFEEVLAKQKRSQASQLISERLQPSLRSQGCHPQPLCIPYVAGWRLYPVCTPKCGLSISSRVSRSETLLGPWPVGCKAELENLQTGRIKRIQVPSQTIQTHLSGTHRLLLLISLTRFKVLARPKSKAEQILANLGTPE